LDGSGSDADRSPARILRLARQLAGKPRRIEIGRQADKLQAITEFDLEELQAVDLPRGYGRD
jgi:hypothetical protein